MQKRGFSLPSMPFSQPEIVPGTLFTTFPLLVMFCCSHVQSHLLAIKHNYKEIIRSIDYRMPQKEVTLCMVQRKVAYIFRDTRYVVCIIRNLKRLTSWRQRVDTFTCLIITAQLSVSRLFHFIPATSCEHAQMLLPYHKESVRLPGGRLPGGSLEASLERSRQSQWLEDCNEFQTCKEGGTQSVSILD